MTVAPLDAEYLRVRVRQALLVGPLSGAEQRVLDAIADYARDVALLAALEDDPMRAMLRALGATRRKPSPGECELGPGQ